MSNFNFITEQHMQEIAQACKDAEKRIHDDPRASFFHARRALEAVVHWLYRYNKSLQMPYDNKLNTLLHEPTFKNFLPTKVWQKTRLIQKTGNMAVHESHTKVKTEHALKIVAELQHIAYWVVRSFAPTAENKDVTWNVANIPTATQQPPTDAKQLQQLEAKISQEQQEKLRVQQEKDLLDAQVQQLMQQLEQAKAQSDKQTDTHDYKEDETRKLLIDVELQRAGWDISAPNVVEYKVSGMPTDSGVGYVDYMLWDDDGKPLAVVEAKRSCKDAHAGKQQAEHYANCIEQMHGVRPVIFYTNGYETFIWDDTFYTDRKVAGFYKKDELQSLIGKRKYRIAKKTDKTDTQNNNAENALAQVSINKDIAGRKYQIRAIKSIFSEFENAQRKALLVMATGTGKTRTAIALIDALQRAGWAKRALFLADRTSLVKQAVRAFKQNLPETSPVNLLETKDRHGRVYACTYQTMLGLIDSKGDKNSSHSNTCRFSVGHFDIIVIDEAHRSVYQKYGAIFEYFDSLLVGLTATPREEIDKNTYSLFEIEDGVPTDAYELAQAVQDGFLVAPKVQQVDMKFPREGIEYDQLSEEDRENWEQTEWGEHAPTSKKIEAGAVNSWLFNQSTTTEMIKHLIHNGHTVDEGDTLAKTIIFARNHDHAVFLEQNLNKQFAGYQGKFVRVIDNYTKDPQGLIDDFSDPNKLPQIAVSVDMLDTGIDIPEVANLVFAKPVYSKIKFWQMIGRGTRLCPDLFGVDIPKTDFRIFDFCGNFKFFAENPEGFSSSGGASLGSRIFSQRVKLACYLQHNATNNTTKTNPKTTEQEAQLHDDIVTKLHTAVLHMNSENFLVRMHGEVVDTFKNKDSWAKINETARDQLMETVARLQTEQPQDNLQSRQFDCTALTMQLAIIENNSIALTAAIKKVQKIAQALEEKNNLTQIQPHLAYLQALQTAEFWRDITIFELEKMRCILRELVIFMDKKQRSIVHTSFDDEIITVTDVDMQELPTMTGAQYELKVKQYLKQHVHKTAIAKLHQNQPLNADDVQELQQVLQHIGEEQGSDLLSKLLSKYEAPSIEYFVRTVVGLDKLAVQKAFEQLLSVNNLTSNQIRFIELVIEQLSARGVIESEHLYEAPFTHLHTSGVDGVFAGKDMLVDSIFETVEQFTAF